MAISREEVKRIGGLARIALTEEEEAVYEKELSSVLEFIAELARADTAGVFPMTGGTEMINVMRPDSIAEGDAGDISAELLDSVPARKDGWVKVPSVFE